MKAPRSVLWFSLAAAAVSICSAFIAGAYAAPVASDGRACTIVGTSKSETIVGTSASDVICGLGGDDRILGGLGNDTIDGGTGADTLLGQSGNDLLIGGTGADTYDGGLGTNRCIWLSGDTKISNCTKSLLPATPASSASPSGSPTSTPSASATSASPQPTATPTTPSSTPTSTPTTPAPTPTATPIGVLLGFESSAAGVTTVDFGGEASTITSAGMPGGGSASNYTALKTVKGNVGWSGVTFYAPTGTQLLSSSYMSISANVWASGSGQVIRLKVENHSDVNLAVETDAVTSVAGWQKLTWNFASPASGTPSYNSSVVYDKVSVFPLFGSTVSGAVFWIDDVALLGATTPAIGFASPTPSPTPTNSPSTGAKVLLWSQEFNGSANSSPDSSVWIADLGDGSVYGNPGWGNGEQQFYGTGAAKIDGQGNLAITATKSQTGTPCYQGTCYWSSSKLTTKQRFGFQYGYIEARIKTPTGAGMWPALWLLGANINENGGSVYWPAAGEIDLMEAKGAAPYTVWGTPHSPNNHSGGVTNSSTSLDSTFHTYAINWSPNKLQWLFDGQVFYEWTPSSSGGTPYPFNAEFYLIVNLAVGGSFGGPVDASLTSGTLLVDYIRYYSVDGIGQLYRH